MQMLEQFQPISAIQRS